MSQRALQSALILRLAIAALVIAAFSALTLLPHFGLDYTQYDKLVHVFAFVTFTSSMIFIFGLSTTLAAVMVAVAISYEAAQFFVPTRTAEFGDGLANVVGVMLSVGLFMMLGYKRRRSVYGRAETKKNGPSPE